MTVEERVEYSCRIRSKVRNMSPSLAEALLRLERSKLNGIHRVRFGIPFLDFFAGSGLVTQALTNLFRAAWANDICPKKRAVYVANHGADHFHLGSIANVRGDDLPEAVLSWASFPCQDLSLAGKLGGISSKRSGLVWEWLRVLDEMKVRPPILVAENVVGLISASKGSNYFALHEALVSRGYRVGTVMLDAARWLPQSRPRAFVIAVSSDVDVTGYLSDGPQWCHPPNFWRTLSGLDDVVWWVLPEPNEDVPKLSDLVEFDAPCHSSHKIAATLDLIPPHHWKRLHEEVSRGERVFAAYKRTRNGKQVLELRFDGVSGCLRTARGGSSRQYLVISSPEGYLTRLLTVREAARLMGAPDDYELPGSYNEAYSAMGDAVAVPAVRHLAKYLLNPLATRVMEVLGDTRTSTYA